MDVNDHYTLPPRSIPKQKVLVNAYGRSSCILVAKNERTEYLEPRCPCMKNLKKLILPVYLLETVNTVVFNELPETVELELSVSLWSTDPTRPLAFQVIHRRPPSGEWPHVSRPTVSCCSWVVKCFAPPTGKRENWNSVFEMFVIGIFMARLFRFCT